MIKVLESAITDLDSKRYSNPADKALSQYVIKNRSSSLKDFWPLLLKKYHNDEPETIYRGLNFNSKEEYDEFIATIEEGKKISLGRITSWSPSKNTAEQFATTKPSFMEYMDFGRMMYIQRQEQEREKITGYRGVILKTEIPKGIAVDMKKFKDHVEDEILLPPGRYDIEIEEILSFKDTVASNNISSLILGMTKKDLEDRYEKSIFWYLENKYKPEDFSAEARNHIYKLTSGDIRFEVERDDYDKKRKKLEVFVDAISPVFLKFYSESQRRSYNSKLKSVLKKVLAKVAELYKPGDRIKWDGINPKVFEEAGLQIEYINLMRKTAGKSYHDLNDDAREKINNLAPNSSEWNQAMDDHIQKIKDSIGSITGGYYSL
jgi:hypothetical protein